MIKLGHVKDFETYKNEIENKFGKVISDNCLEQLEILDEYYGEDRDIFNDDGGYLVLLETKEDWETFNKETCGMLEEEMYENRIVLFESSLTDGKLKNTIMCNYVRDDYLVNNETMISVYLPKQKLFKK